MRVRLILLSLIFFNGPLFSGTAKGIISLLALHKELARIQVPVSKEVLAWIQKSIHEAYETDKSDKDIKLKLKSQLSKNIKAKWEEFRDTELKKPIAQSLKDIMSAKRIEELWDEEFSKELKVGHGTLPAKFVFTENYSDSGRGSDLRDLLVREDRIQELLQLVSTEWESVKNNVSGLAQGQVQAQLEQGLQNVRAEKEKFKKSAISFLQIKLLEAEKRKLIADGTPDAQKKLSAIDNLLAQLKSKEVSHAGEVVKRVLPGGPASQVLELLGVTTLTTPYTLYRNQISPTAGKSQASGAFFPFAITDKGVAYFVEEIIKEGFKKDLKIFVLDIAQKKVIQTFDLKDAQLSSRVLATSNNRNIRLYIKMMSREAYFDPLTGAVTRVPHFTVAVSDDGNTTFALDAEGLHTRTQVEPGLFSVRHISGYSPAAIRKGMAISKDGKKIATLQYEGKTHAISLIVYDGQANSILMAQLDIPKHANEIESWFCEDSIDISADGRLVVTLANEKGYVYQAAFQAIVWDIITKQALAYIPWEVGPSSTSPCFVHIDTKASFLVGLETVPPSLKFVALSGITEGSAALGLGGCILKLPLKPDARKKFLTSPQGSWTIAWSENNKVFYVWNVHGLASLNELQQLAFDGYKEKVPQQLTGKQFEWLRKLKNVPAFTIPEQWDKWLVFSK